MLTLCRCTLPAGCCKDVVLSLRWGGVSGGVCSVRRPVVSAAPLHGLLCDDDNDGT